MSTTKISGLPGDVVKKIHQSRLDANNQPLEVHTSDGNGNLCRHCLQMIGEGDEYYILAHRPFTVTQPYAEMGPIFLHVKNCSEYEDSGGTPEALTNKDNLLLRGYDEDERIVYGTGGIVPTQNIREHAEKLLQLDRVSFVHIRSANYNCYQARIDPV